MDENRIAAAIFLGPILVVTLPIWLPTLLVIKLFSVVTRWALK